MAKLKTTEQALTYLAEMSPTETFHANPFKDGWVCTRVLTPEQMNSGAAVGLARLVIDSETGIVYQYPSWSETMVAEAHTTFKQTGINRAARQIYPYQWRITVQRIREDQETIVYQLRAESLTNPPEPSQQHPLTIEKQTYTTNPTDWMSTVAMSHAEWMSRQNQGVWPETDTTQPSDHGADHATPPTREATTTVTVPPTTSPRTIPAMGRAAIVSSNSKTVHTIEFGLRMSNFGLRSHGSPRPMPGWRSRASPGAISNRCLSSQLTGSTAHSETSSTAFVTSSRMWHPAKPYRK